MPGRQEYDGEERRHDDRRPTDERIEELERRIDALSKRIEQHEKDGAKRSADLTAQIVTIQGRVNILTSFDERLHAIEIALFGDRTAIEKPNGMVYKIDRIASTIEVLVKIGWIIAGAALTTGVGLLLAHLFNPNLP